MCNFQAESVLALKKTENELKISVSISLWKSIAHDPALLYPWVSEPPWNQM